MKKLIILFMLISPMARGQAKLYIPGFGSASTYSLNSSTDTVGFFSVYVANLATSSNFSDTLRFYVGVEDVLGQVQVMTFNDLGYQSILATDTITIPHVTVGVNPAFFQEGNNTVVIWPACPGTITHDSLFLTVTFTSVNELIFNDLGVKMGPNPATDNFCLADPYNLVKQVRIRNLEGQLLFTGGTNQIINVSGLRNSMYLVELEAINGKVYTRKLIISR